MRSRSLRRAVSPAARAWRRAPRWCAPARRARVSRASSSTTRNASTWKPRYGGASSRAGRSDQWCWMAQTGPSDCSATQSEARAPRASTSPSCMATSTSSVPSKPRHCAAVITITQAACAARPTASGRPRAGEPRRGPDEERAEQRRTRRPTTANASGLPHALDGGRDADQRQAGERRPRRSRRTRVGRRRHRAVTVLRRAPQPNTPKVVGARLRLRADAPRRAARYAAVMKTHRLLASADPERGRRRRPRRTRRGRRWPATKPMVVRPTTR